MNATPDGNQRARDESLLVLRAQTGDRAALGDLYSAVAAPLTRHLRNILRDDSAAEDVLHDVFIVVHRKLGWLRDPDLFRPWIYRIATREAIRVSDRRRKTAYETDDSSTLDDLATAPGASPETLAAGREAITAVARTTPASRAVLSLHYIEGLTLSEAAAVLDLPIGTVKSRLAAGIQQLRDLFQPREGRR